MVGKETIKNLNVLNILGNSAKHFIYFIALAWGLWSIYLQDKVVEIVTNSEATVAIKEDVKKEVEGAIDRKIDNKIMTLGLQKDIIELRKEINKVNSNISFILLILTQSVPDSVYAEAEEIFKRINSK